MLDKKEIALTNLSQELYLLDSLTRDNKVQSENLRQLDNFTYKEITSLNIANTNQPINPLVKEKTTEGLLAMDSVMALLEKMYGAETGLLQLRTKKYAQLSSVTPLYIIVLSLGALAILLASYIKINTALFNSKYLHNELYILNEERELKAAELFLANKELEFQNKQKEQKAAELILANKELAFQNREKERRAAELIIANKELEFQNREKERKAAELIIANKELEFQNKEKEQRAAELIIANKELELQNRDKERKAKELVIANKELAFQNKEKEQRAAELVIANKELLSENEIKEQRATELTNVNEELRMFTQIASHDLQEPLRKIQMFTSRILDNDAGRLSEKGKIHFEIIGDAATRMRALIEDLITYSHANNNEKIFEMTNLNEIVDEVKIDLEHSISEKMAIIETNNLMSVKIIPFQFRQLFNNLISNALKFSIYGVRPHIIIDCEIKKGKELDDKKLLPDKAYCHISLSNNGIGFEKEYNEKIFEVFQRLHGKEKYKGTGIGLAIVKKIVENHDGIITASGKPGKGARFDIYTNLIEVCTLNL
jgi:signal transduction histidine kinase